eukprot:7706567-Pyramimonas_sp.AAC.1
MLRLYGPPYVKIKTHLCHHIPEVIQRAGANFNCFSNERRNRLLKAVCVYTTHIDEPSASLMGRILLDLEDRISKAPAASEYLTGPKKEAPELLEFFDEHDPPTKVYASKQMVWARGTLRAGDVVSAKRECGHDGFLSILGCMEAVYSSNPTMPACVVVGQLSSPTGPDPLLLS